MHYRSTLKLPSASSIKTFHVIIGVPLLESVCVLHAAATTAVDAADFSCGVGPLVRRNGALLREAPWAHGQKPYQAQRAMGRQVGTPRANTYESCRTRELQRFQLHRPNAARQLCSCTQPSQNVNDSKQTSQKMRCLQSSQNDW